jgi:pilus assembly protein Flp/PilA
MLARLRRIARHDEGASAVEYGLLVSAIAAVIIVIVFAFGSLVQNVFEKTCLEIVTNGQPLDIESSCSTG